MLHNWWAALTIELYFTHLVLLPVGFVLVVRRRRPQRNGGCSTHGGLAP